MAERVTQTLGSTSDPFQVGVSSVDWRRSLISIFHGNDEETHENFQAWRRSNVNGFHMTESTANQFTIHYTQDRRENTSGRGCMHQGTSDFLYLEDKGGCYTTARKVCSNNFLDLVAWATAN